jgi:hypothetical protein
MAVHEARTRSPVNRRADPSGAQTPAVRIHRFGSPEVLVIESVPPPVASPGDLLVGDGVLGWSMSATGHTRGKIVLAVAP